MSTSKNVIEIWLYQCRIDYSFWNTRQIPQFSHHDSLCRLQTVGFVRISGAFKFHDSQSLILAFTTQQWSTQSLINILVSMLLVTFLFISPPLCLSHCIPRSIRLRNIFDSSFLSWCTCPSIGRKSQFMLTEKWNVCRVEIIFFYFVF